MKWVKSFNNMTPKSSALKMVQHTHYDRKTGKLVKTMVPQSTEHAKRSEAISKHLSSHKTPSDKEKHDYQKKVGRAYSE